MLYWENQTKTWIIHLTLLQGIKIEINMPAIGIIANFSSIKKLRMEQFRIVVTEFGKLLNTMTVLVFLCDLLVYI